MFMVCPHWGQVRSEKKSSYLVTAGMDDLFTLLHLAVASLQGWAWRWLCSDETL